MTTIGILGSGHVGSNLARAAIVHGYDVVLSNSQGPESLAPAGPPAREPGRPRPQHDQRRGTVGRRPPRGGDPKRRALALAGDDPAAKQLVAGLYDEFGFDPVDIGGLDESWRIDAGQPAFVVRQDVAELKANVARATRHA